MNIATTQSIGVNRIDYNYSESLYSGGQSSGVSKDVYKPSFDFGPSISGFDYLRGNPSKVGEVWWWFDLDLSLSNVEYYDILLITLIIGCSK